MQHTSERNNNSTVSYHIVFTSTWRNHALKLDIDLQSACFASSSEVIIGLQNVLEFVVWAALVLFRETSDTMGNKPWVIMSLIFNFSAWSSFISIGRVLVSTNPMVIPIICISIIVLPSLTGLRWKTPELEIQLGLIHLRITATNSKTY